MKTKRTKMETIRKLEANGLSFTVNVILSGCSKPTTKLNTLCDLIELGADVRPAQFEVYTVIVSGRAITLTMLDNGADAVLKGGTK